MVPTDNLCVYVELLLHNMFSFWQDYGTNCRQLLCSGLDYSYEQQIVDLHNELRRRVAKGLETRGNPGPQPPAANMQNFVSKIFLSLNQFANNHNNMASTASGALKPEFRWNSWRVLGILV